MDGMVLPLFLAGTFLGGLTSGLAGFAMGLVVSGVWLHLLSPQQTAVLIVGYGLLTQGYAIWKLRRALDWTAFVPFVIGSLFGVPVGTMLLALVAPNQARLGVGILLLAYSAYNLWRPRLKPIATGIPSDMAVGAVNGLLGGMTGLTGIVVTIWCQFIGLAKDQQRAVFQPVNLATIVLSALALTFEGAVTAETLRLYLLGLPMMLLGLWSGFKLYGKLDDLAFRKIVLVLLMVSGMALVGPQILRMI